MPLAPAKGRQAKQEYLATFLGGFPDFSIENRNVFGSDDWFVAEITATGTHTEALQAGPEKQWSAMTELSPSQRRRGRGGRQRRRLGRPGPGDRSRHPGAGRGRGVERPGVNDRIRINEKAVQRHLPPAR